MSTEDGLVRAEDVDQTIVYLRLNSPSRPTRRSISKELASIAWEVAHGNKRSKHVLNPFLPISVL